MITNNSIDVYIKKIILTFPSTSKSELIEENKTYLKLIKLLGVNSVPNIEKPKRATYKFLQRYSNEISINCYGPKNNLGLHVHSVNPDFSSNAIKSEKSWLTQDLNKFFKDSRVKIYKVVFR